MLGLMNGLRNMSKGRKMTQWEKDRIKSAQAKLKKEKPTPIIKGGFDKGILTFSEASDGGYTQILKARQMGISGWNLEQLKALMQSTPMDKNIFFDEYTREEKPKDTRTEGEKWADDWAAKQNI